VLVGAGVGGLGGSTDAGNVCVWGGGGRKDVMT
jgi:hypothetical protein